MSTKKRSVKSLAEKIVPIPPEFYEGNKDEDLIASKTVLVPFAVLLQFAQWAAFAGFVAYYSSPASYLTESTIQGEWNYGGSAYNCTPMSPDLGYGVRFNYETCKSLMQAPDENTVSYYNTTEVAFDDQAGTAPAYGYEPFKGIVIAEKQVKLPIFKPNAIYYKPGMKPTDRKAAILAVYDPVKTLNSCGRVGLPVSVGEIPGGKFEDISTYQWGAERGAGVLYPYEIFATQVKEIAAYKHPMTQVLGCFDTTISYVCGSYKGEGDKCCGTSSDGSVVTSNLCEADNKCKNFAEDVAGECGANLASNLAFDACCDFTLSAPAKYCELTSCDYNPAKCHEACTITKAEAIAMFKKFVETHDACDFAKLNSPFICVKRAPRAILERISLAYANSLLVFTVFSALCVKIFFASSKKGKETGEEAASPA